MTLLWGSVQPPSMIHNDMHSKLNSSSCSRHLRGRVCSADGSVTFGCGQPGGGKCSDGSKCKPAGVTGYGGDGHDASANSPLPGLEMSLAQFKV